MIDYKIYVLRRGGIYKEIIWDVDKPPDIIFDASSKIKSSLKGSFVYDPDINFMTDELQPVLIKDGVEQPLGVYLPTTADYSGGIEDKTTRVEAYDRCWVLDHVKTESIIHMDAGAKYIDEIIKQLTAVGIYRYTAEEADDVLPCAREDWPVGTSRLEIVNQLLSEIGFDSIFFDAEGVAVLRRYRPPSAGNIVRHYSASDLHRLPIAPEYKEASDIFSAPNVFLLICSNADRETPLTATAVNDSPLSAKSVVNRGLRIPDVKKVDQISDQAALQTMANRLRDDSLLSAHEVSISVLPEGGHNMGDTISVDHQDIGGIYRETGWSLRLKWSELMELSLRREVLK